MAAESELQRYLDKAQANVAAAYHSVMKDGSVAAIGREGIKDVRNTINEIFFGRSDRGVEPGTPLNPLFSDLAEDRRSHEASLDSLTASPSPADLVERGAGPEQQRRKGPRLGT